MADESTRITVRCILGAYQSEGIDAQATAVAGFIEKLIESRDTLADRWRDEAEKRWQERIAHMDRLLAQAHVAFAEPLYPKKSATPTEEKFEPF